MSATLPDHPTSPVNFDSLRHYLRARLFQLLKQPRRAIEEYRLALRFKPDFTAAASALAFLLAGEHRYAEAEPLLRDCLRASPRQADGWFNLGYVCAEQHRDAEAIEAFREAVRLNRKLDRAWYGLGLALAAQANHDEAVTAFEQAAQLQPMNGHIWYQLGMVQHARQDADKVKGIVQHLDRFDRRMARKLVLDTARTDLSHIVADLRDLN